jgi:hypothetical protein
VASRAQARTMASGKDVKFGAEARAMMLAGVDKLADAVQVRFLRFLLHPYMLCVLSGTRRVSTANARATLSFMEFIYSDHPWTQGPQRNPGPTLWCTQDHQGALVWSALRLDLWISSWYAELGYGIPSVSTSHEMWCTGRTDCWWQANQVNHISN